jgi:hypothetical protein
MNDAEQALYGIQQEKWAWKLLVQVAIRCRVCSTSLILLYNYYKVNQKIAMAYHK